jgi:ferredoxin
MALPTIFLLTTAFLFTILAASFSILSIQERESRAAWIGFFLSLLGLAAVITIFYLPEQLQLLLSASLGGLLVLNLIGFFLPIGKIQSGPIHPEFQVDERTIMFARSRLEPDSSDWDHYYQDHPEHLPGDLKTRRNPGLLNPEAKFTDPLTSAAAGASFYLTDALSNAVQGQENNHLAEIPASKLTAYLKELALYYGALDVGITPLRKSHIYSRIGRGSGAYGAPIELDHQFALAFTVEMDFQKTRMAPKPALTMESGRQYVESARVAVQLAAALRDLGYPARAHIDGNYRVIAPLVARDAGLGEIGRMGLLMTPRQGPRVRIGVVTTSAPLQVEDYRPNPALLDFCTTCRRCAVLCPSQSIPKGNRLQERGITRWKINPDTCYRYWSVVGTDCGRCLAVCPYSHPDNWLHNAVRWGIQQSGLFRRAALQLEILFYGKNPPSLKPASPFVWDQDSSH